MAYNTVQKLRDNLDAIRIALAYEQGRPLSADDAATLGRYSGFGGIKAILYPYGPEEQWLAAGATKEDMRLYGGIQELHDVLRQAYPDNVYKQLIESLRSSVLTAFYTPQVVPRTLYEVLESQGAHPKRMYEPSAGAGVFIHEAIAMFPGMNHITAVEKDRLTGMILAAANSTLPIATQTHITGFEQAPVKDNGTYDLITSNIPFGNFAVYDDAFPDKSLSGKIHNYFFAKGLDKLAEGGLMAYLTTEAFLNSPSNHTARQYLFERADLISLQVMPDNLMKETGNTEAPIHLLVVQKHTGKEKMSGEEERLIETVEKHNEFGKYTLNAFIAEHGQDITIGNRRQPGTNQYGKATERIWQDGDINNISGSLKESLVSQFTQRFNKSLFTRAQHVQTQGKITQLMKLTYLPMPDDKQITASTQLGLFDTAATSSVNRAMAYINDADEKLIQPYSARLVSTISTTDNPMHECVVLLTAKHQKNNRYQYKLASNVSELSSMPKGWIDASELGTYLSKLSAELGKYDHAGNTCCRAGQGRPYYRSG